MSLLIDALKRAERAKNGQSEPALDSRNTIERAVDSATTSLDWSLAEPLADPVIGTETPLVTEPSARTEPKFAEPVENIPLREAVVSAPPAAATKSWAATKSDQAIRAQGREAAQTLFDAKRPAMRSRAGMLALLGLAALILASGGFYVWYSLAFPPSPVYPAIQARPVAPQSTSTVEVAPPPKPVEPAATIATPAIEAKVAEIPSTSSLTIPLETPAVSEPVGAEVPPAAPKNISKRKPRQSVANATSVSDISSEEIVKREVDQAQRSQATKRGKAAADNGTINVGKTGQNSFDADIALAYNSLLSGNRAEAKRLYSIAAERDPFNTDALLGLATIAGNQGDMNGAERYYRRTLELDPQNAAAIAGLSSIRQPGGPSESQLKFELARSPDSAPLQFALGNQFANQGRWDEAQQAYFDAFSADARNADYAYNLAVSLDQLNQTKQAVIYYKKAQELAKIHGARFRSSDINARLNELGHSQ
jgi:tetratricopeptide (TPR) repeat protein